MNKLEIINGRIIDPANHLDEYENLYIADGRIVAKSKNRTADFNADLVIDASKLIVSPGFIDLDASLGCLQQDLAMAQKELAVALASGITSLCIPPQRSNDLFQTPIGIEWLIQTCKKFSKINLLPLAALTQNLDGKQLNELALLQQAGCVAVTNDSYAIYNTEIKRRCYEYAAGLDLKIFIYPIDPWLKNEGCIHEGEVSTRLGLRGISALAETTALAQELLLLENIGANAHLCRLSTAKSIELLHRFKPKQVTADVAAHQLLLTEIDASDFNSIFHVYPPLRTENDRYSLEKGLKDNIINALCSHHQPVTKMAKYAPFPETQPGMSTLETLLSQTLRIAKNLNLPLTKALSWITSAPANILAIDAGTLSIGAKADICIFDPEKTWTVSNQTLQSFGHNTPFMNWDFFGQVQYTLIDGEIVFQT